MGALCYTLIEAEDELGGFDCGNPSINKLVSESYYSHILKQTRVYKLSIQGQRVGFCSVSILGISLESSDAPIAEYFDKTPSFGAVMLNYLAVDARVQHLGIGSTALEYIIAEAQTLYTLWPVRLLVIDALRNKIDWYTNHGFEILNKADLNGISETVQMYFDLMPAEDQKSIEDYVYY